MDPPTEAPSAGLKPPGRGRALLAVATVTGVCIVVLAFFSRRVFREPISDAYLAVPPLLMTVHQMALNKAGDSWIWRTSTWALAIVGATALIIALGWN